MFPLRINNLGELCDVLPPPENIKQKSGRQTYLFSAFKYIR